MYRCIANLEIDLDGLGEFYGEIGEYEILNMYQIISIIPSHNLFA